jgi:LuxR family maltose regulon positive regulatory protein
MASVPRGKIEVPPLPAGFVRRDGLRAEVEAGVQGAVGLVCAPAGFGKTVLLADWAAASHEDVAWVDLDRDDDEPHRLWAAIGAALARCPSVPATSPLRSPRPWRPDARPEYLAELVDDLARLPRPIRLVLDDLHAIEDPATLWGLGTLIRNRPPTLRLVLASRSEPPLTLPRLRLSGRVHELRADRLRFTQAETGAFLRAAGLPLSADRVELLHRRTGGWVAGLRLASLAVAEAEDVESFLDGFSGDDPSVADYLAGEVLGRLPGDVRGFLRAVSISDPVPAELAAELTDREDAGHLLQELEHRTALVQRVPGRPEAGGSYRIQELLRSHLAADLSRRGRTHAERLHGRAARWWATHDGSIRALDHAALAADPALTVGLLHRFAVPLFLTGDHRTLRRAFDALETGPPEPWIDLTSALTHLGVGEVSEARADLRRAVAHWPVNGSASGDGYAELRVLRTAAEQLGARPPVPVRRRGLPRAPELSGGPAFEGLARLSRGIQALAEYGDRVAARGDLEAALRLGRTHGYDYLSMQCLAFLGFLASTAGDIPAMSAIGDQAAVTASAHGWEDSVWSAAAQTMLAFAALHRCRPAEAIRHADRGIAIVCAPERSDDTDGGEIVRPMWAALCAVRGAAVFDRGDRAGGLARIRQARTDLGELPVVAEQAALCAVLEFRAALALGHTAAARTVQGWLAERTAGHPDNAELVLMRAWTDAATGHLAHARTLVAPIRAGMVPALLGHSLVEAWLVEASAAVEAGERPAAREAVAQALALSEPLEVLRPFAHADGRVRDLLAQQLGSFGGADAFAERALAVGVDRPTAPALSERELTVLGLLPSMLSLDEIAADLAVSVNTVKSHVRSIYTKLGVGSRRLAVLAGHEQGLLAGAGRRG